MLDQCYTPLFDALIKHYRRQPACLHVPAHRLGQAAPQEWAQLQNFFSIDVTELPGLDDLHRPAGVIAAAQQLAAQLYGADHTFFLVNGTTGGLQALLMALCRPGEEILLPRNAHRAVTGGLILSGAVPVYLPPAVVEDGIAAGVPAPVLAGALKRHPGVRGFLAVYPNYYGVAQDLAGPAGLLHRWDKPLLVDEAHGAHLPFHPVLPPPALSAGADASVQSMHKLGGSLTQTSLLHLKGTRLDGRRVAGALHLLQTSSPSYVLMASLDTARRQLACTGRQLLDQALTLAFDLRRELARIPGLSLLGKEHLIKAGEAARYLDPTRVVVSVKGLGLTGYQAAALLAKKYRVMVEMADYYHLVAVLGIGTMAKDCQALAAALRDMAVRVDRPRERKFVCPDLPPIPPLVMPPRQAWQAPAKALPLAKARGQVSAETVAVYPPGIPSLCPGEEITPEIIDYLTAARRHGLAVQGPADRTLRTLQVVS